MNLKRFLKMLITDPNSPEGLRIRAEKIEEEFGLNHPYARALRKMANHNEGKTKK